MTGLRRRSPRPRSTVRSGRSPMKGISHQVPVNPVGAHARSLLAGKEVSYVGARRCAAEAGPDTATHRGLERHLNGREGNLLTMGCVDQRREHWGGAACEDVKAPTLSPSKRGREKRHNRTTKAFACVVGGHA